MNFDYSRIQHEYDRLLEYCSKNDVSEYMLKMTQDFQQGTWKSYLECILARIGCDWSDKTVLDYGCKFGHLFPLLHALGVVRIVGVEIEDDYIKEGRKTLGQLYESVSYVKPDSIGYLPIDQDELSIDVIIVNEVISHINPMFLDIVLMELARVLRMGGVLFISDGNNLGFPGYKDKLLTLYELWENGPDGAKTDRDVVTKSYVTRRKEIIRGRHPDMQEADVLHLARNTSGLWGDYLNQVIDNFAISNKLTKRPYRYGTCPVNPGFSGVVMERAFFPQQVGYMLYEKGLNPTIVPPPRPRLKSYGNSPVGLLKFIVRSVQYVMKDVFRPGWRSAANEGFQVLARKVI